MSIEINGVKYSGQNITVRNNKIVIDGVDQTPDSKEITVIVEGDIDSIQNDKGKIEVKGYVRFVDSVNGDVHVHGGVDAGVKTINGNVTCGFVNGPVSTVNGNIKHVNPQEGKKYE